MWQVVRVSKCETASPSAGYKQPFLSLLCELRWRVISFCKRGVRGWLVRGGPGSWWWGQMQVWQGGTVFIAGRFWAGWWRCSCWCIRGRAEEKGCKGSDADDLRVWDKFPQPQAHSARRAWPVADPGWWCWNILITISCTRAHFIWARLYLLHLICQRQYTKNMNLVWAKEIYCTRFNCRHKSTCYHFYYSLV